MAGKTGCFWESLKMAFCLRNPGTLVTCPWVVLLSSNVLRGHMSKGQESAKHSNILFQVRLGFQMAQQFGLLGALHLPRLLSPYWTSDLTSPVRWNVLTRSQIELVAMVWHVEEERGARESTEREKGGTKREMTVLTTVNYLA